MRFTNFFAGLAVATLLPVCAFNSQAQPNPLNSLAQPGTEYSSQEFGTSPSMAVFNGKIYIAYQSNYSDHTTWITSSSDGVNFSSPQHYTNFLSKSATGPTIIAWNGWLWLAYTGVDRFVYLASSSDGIDFSGAYAMFEPADSSPTLAVFNNLLWITVEENGSGSATNMVTFTTANGGSAVEVNYCGTAGPNGEQPQTGAAIGLTVFNNRLYFAFQAQGNWSHELLVCSTDGIHNGTSNVYPNLEVGSGISATAYNGALYLAYKVLSGNNNLTIAETTNGTTFSTNVYSNIKINGRQQINPSTAVFGSYYYLTYASNDGDHHMYLTVN
jgi:hypothetical protein